MVRNLRDDLTLNTLLDHRSFAAFGDTLFNFIFNEWDDERFASLQEVFAGVKAEPLGQRHTGHYTDWQTAVTVFTSVISLYTGRRALQQARPQGISPTVRVLVEALLLVE